MEELYYSRLSTKKKETDMKNMGPADIGKMSKKVHLTSEKKEQCEKIARKIIEFLIDRTLDPTTFKRCLRHINPQHFQDVVEERAISKQCGYPICSKNLPPMPAKKYHISTKNNKVFDITERKNFCSNFCFTASDHIRKQIDTSPLWLRTYYTTPQYRLLENAEKIKPGVEYGEEEDADVNVPVKEIETIESFVEESAEIFKPSTSSSSNTSKQPKNEKTKAKMKSTKKVQFCEEDNVEIYDEGIDIELEETMQTSEVGEQKSILKKTETIYEEQEEDDDVRAFRENKNSLKITAIKETVVAREAPTEKPKQTQNRNVKSIKNDPKVENELVEHIKKCLNDWLTLETFLFLYGEEKLKQVFQEHKIQEDIVKKLKENKNASIQQQKYAEICKRLNLMALADKKFDNACLENAKKPLPNFRTLKEQSRTMDIKVKSFYHGAEVKIEEDSDDDPDKGEETVEKIPAVIPMTSASSQNALRKKVFLTSVNRVIYKMIQVLGLCSHSIITDINSLVNTFKLQPHSIVFKPKQWNLVGSILISILCVKDEKLKSQLDSKEAKDYVIDVLKSLNQNENSLETLLEDSLNISKYLVNVYLN